MNLDEKDKEILIRQTVLLEQVVKQVGEIQHKMDSLNNGHVMKTESRLAVAEEKVSRLEKILYGAIGLILAEVVSNILQWTQHH